MLDHRQNPRQYVVKQELRQAVVCHLGQGVNVGFVRSVLCRSQGSHSEPACFTLSVVCTDRKKKVFAFRCYHLTTALDLVTFHAV